MKPRLFRALNAYHRSSVMAAPDWTPSKVLASCYNRESPLFPCGRPRRPILSPRHLAEPVLMVQAARELLERCAGTAVPAADS